MPALPFPRRPLLRALAVVWTAAAAFILAVTLVRLDTPPGERAALSGLVWLYFLSLPAGHLVMLGIGWIKQAPSLLAECILLWTALTLLGYAQWFLLVPCLAGRLRRLIAALADRLAAR